MHTKISMEVEGRDGIIVQAIGKRKSSKNYLYEISRIRKQNIQQLFKKADNLSQK